MNFKKRVNGSWVDTPHYIHNTSTDTITTLPAVLYPTGTTATVGLKGQATQSGTPTPDNPVMPQGTGKRTGNLADLYNVNARQVGLTFSTTDNMRIVINGTKIDGQNIVPITRPNIILPAGTYTVKIKMVSGEITGLTSDGVMFGINANTYAQRTSVVTKVGEIGKRTFTLSEDTTISRFDITPSYGSVGAVFDNATFECWLYSGSDDMPYEPWGVKIPISSANTTTNNYLGEVESTRRIEKLVLTGEEEWQFFSDSIGSWQFYINNISLGGVTQSSCVSNIAPYGVTAATRQRYDYGCYLVTSGSGIAFQMKGAKDTFTGITAWKSYLAAQYTNGTPVTVWYVLAEPGTAVVNEPLMRIGDYADTLSGITIPTIAGANTISVDTTLQPSEVTVNYKGWHPVTDVHERENGAWT